MSDTNKEPGETRTRGERGPDKRPRKGSPREGKRGHPKVDGKLLPTKEAALVMFAAGARTRKIAQTLEVSERTLNRWLSDPGFSAELAQRQASIRSGAERVLHGAAERLARRLVHLSHKGTKEDMAQVKATEGGLDRIGMVKRTVIEHVQHDPLDEASDEELESMIREEAEALLREGGWIRREEAEATLVVAGWIRPST